MPSGPRFPPGEDNVILWKNACAREDKVASVHAQQNELLASLPKKDAVALFKAKNAPLPLSRTEHPISQSSYQMGPLDVYHRDAVVSGAVVPAGGESQGQQRASRQQASSSSKGAPSISTDASQSAAYAQGKLLACSNETYGWGQNNDNRRIPQWHGRKKWNDMDDSSTTSTTSTKAPTSERDGRAWHGRRKWNDNAVADGEAMRLW